MYEKENRLKTWTKLAFSSGYAKKSLAYPTLMNTII